MLSYQVSCLGKTMVHLRHAGLSDSLRQWLENDLALILYAVLGGLLCGPPRTSVCRVCVASVLEFREARVAAPEEAADRRGPDRGGQLQAETTNDGWLNA